MKKFLLWALGLVVAALLVLFGSIYFLGEDWLKGQLEQGAAEAGADLRIDSLSFAPFRGEAGLQGVRLQQRDEFTEVDIKVADGRMQLKLMPLLFRSVRVARFELNQPEIKMVSREDPNQPEQSLIDKLKELGKAKKEAEAQYAEAKQVDFVIDRLAIEDGVFDYTTIDAEGVPFRAKVFEMDYRAENVSLDNLYPSFLAADIDAKFDIYGLGRIAKAGTAKPATFALYDLNLGPLDKRFNPGDALRMTAGKLDLGGKWARGEEVRVDLAFKGLDLARNPAAEKGGPAGVVLDKAIEYVRKKEGNLDLSLAIAPDALSPSQEPGVAVAAVRDALWDALLEKAKDEAVDKLIEKGADKLMDLLNEKKDEEGEEN